MVAIPNHHERSIHIDDHVCITLGNGCPKISHGTGNGITDPHRNQWFSLSINSGECKQVQNHSIHSPGTVADEANKFMPICVKVMSVAAFNQVNIAADHTEWLTKIMGCDVGKLLKFSVGCRQILTGNSQFFFALLSDRDIKTIADIPEKFAGLVLNWDSVIYDPTVFATGTLDAVFHVERLTKCEGIKINFQAAIKIIRMDTFRPSVPHLLLHCPAGIGEPCGVEPIAFGIETCTPDQNRGSF
ncbi:hypothetical protein WV31_02655 [Magnetospirillum sp. ME-1]|nr:hypothetical protein WV31_02655 [Magnetospirillum sp. ME-1]